MKRMDRILSLLSLSAKGRNLVSGEFMAEKAIKEGRLVLHFLLRSARSR